MGLRPTITHHRLPKANPADWMDLADGRRIMLASLKQCLTYGGLLLGVPEGRVSQNCVEFAMPIDPAVFAAIQALALDGVAMDVSD